MSRPRVRPSVRACVTGFVLLPAAVQGQGIVGDSSCVTCHASHEDTVLSKPAIVFETDVHAQAGLSCLDCHGRTHRDGTTGMAFLERPARRDVPRMCGTCHSDARYMRDFNPSLRVDQEEEYATSVHGQLLFSRNDEDVATCNDCHPTHEILPPSEPESSVHPLNVATLCGMCHSDDALMDPRGMESHQEDEYRAGVHGTLLYEDGDLSAPTCNDCHGNHGAAPPGVFGIGNVCGGCHSVMMDFFEGSGHAEYFEDEGFPGCATCHGNHAVETVTDQFLVDRSEDTCAACHEADDVSGRNFLSMKALIDSLELERERSRVVVDSARNLGMEVEEAIFELDEVSNALTKARTAIHSLEVDPVRAEIDAGLQVTEDTRQQGVAALEEHRFRRVGLGVSAGIIVLLCLTLALKIRDLESPARELMDAVEDFFQRAMGEEHGGRWQGSSDQLRLAACALLLELAHTDASFTGDEREHLEDLIRSYFDLSYPEAERLIELAKSERAKGMGLKKFTALIRERLDHDSKATLMEVMGKLIMSEGRLAERGDHLIQQIGREIGIGEGSRAETHEKGS